MTDTLLKQLDDLVGSDDFEPDSEEIIEKLEEEGAGFEIVGKLFAIMEKHPLDDFGMPGATVHFIERFYPDYIPLLTESVNRAPALHTVWMLNRCINGADDKESLLAVLRKTADDPSVDSAIRELAGSFLEHRD